MPKLILALFLLTEVVVVGLLAGCGATFNYDALRASKAEGDGFAPALSRQYKAFALFEADQMMDWPNAAHFGEKSLAAAKGIVPPPEDLRDWSLPAGHVGEMVDARARLTAALDRGAGQYWPVTAAVAQARFDCWVEQQEENWQTADIARCRNGFYAAMQEVEQRMAAATRTFIVPFAFGSARLDDGARATVAAVAGLADAGKDVRIVIGGYADRAGPDAYNDRLSWRRAEALSRALVARGVAAGRISVAAFGERRLLVPTADGVPEMRNRRVEVTVGPAAPL